MYVSQYEVCTTAIEKVMLYHHQLLIISYMVPIIATNSVCIAPHCHGSEAQTMLL